jgi:hypothetical protein
MPLLLRKPLVEFLVLDSFARQPCFLLFMERVVVARPGRESAAVELDDAVATR